MRLMLHLKKNHQTYESESCLQMIESGRLNECNRNTTRLKKINPLIGSAGVSAVPMAARVSQTVGAQCDPQNFLLMHAMGPNVAGVIGSGVAAGTLLAVFGN